MLVCTRDLRLRDDITDPTSIILYLKITKGYIKLVYFKFVSFRILNLYQTNKHPINTFKKKKINMFSLMIISKQKMIIPITPIGELKYLVCFCQIDVSNKNIFICIRKSTLLKSDY